MMDEEVREALELSADDLLRLLRDGEVAVLAQEER